MDDVFDIGYVIFILVIFLFSIIKNLAKAKKSPQVPTQNRPLSQRPLPQRPLPQRPFPPAGPVAPTKPAAEDFIERKLAELLGLDVPPVPPQPVPPPKPAQPASVSREREKPQVRETRPTSPAPSREVAHKAASLLNQKPAQMTMRERFIWAEILAPPRARRRGRAI